MSRRKFLWASVGVAICLAIAAQVMQRIGRVDTVGLVSEAADALARQDVKTAGDLLDQALAYDPTNAPALIQRGKLWSSIGDYENAIADWRKVDIVAERDQSQKLASEARLLEGMLQVKLHRAPAAERALLEAWELRRSEEMLPSLELLLRIYVLQMRRDEIKNVLNVIETYRPLSLEEMVLRADAGAPIIAEGDALEQLREFIAGDPDDLFSVVALARYLLSAEKFSEVEGLLQTVPKKLADQSSLLGLKALSQFKVGNAEAAKATMSIPPPEGAIDYWWWLAAGELAEANQQLQIACDCFGLACQAQPDSGYSRYRHGLALHATGQKEASGNQLRTAAAIDRLHQQTEAITRLANLAPADFVSGLLRISSTQHELGNAGEATGWARLSQQIDPNNRMAWELSRSLQSAPSEMGSSVAVSSGAARAHFREWIVGPERNAVLRPDLATRRDNVTLRFEDVHEAAELDFQYFNGNSGFKYLIEAMGGGVSVLDFDNDGWPDCYFPQGCKFPFDSNDFSYLDQIYRNIDGKRFANATQAARIVENSYSQGAATADINNDGFADIVVANFGRNRVFINQGDGTYFDASEPWGMGPSEMSSSLALADLNQDGNLDLYVVNYVDEIRVCRDTQGNVSTCNPQNFNGVQDRLYQNSGDGRFVDVTQESGVLATDGKGLGVVVTDLDDDGLLDIYVTNDTTPNFLFKNLGNMRFAEVGLESGTALSDEGQAQAGMGIAAGDLDGDLRTDLFVTNFYLEANNLYRNFGAMNFKDEAMNAKLSVPSRLVLGFGTQAEDFDLDGDLDLIVANGHIDDYTLRGDPWKMPTQLFRNLGDGTFEECSISAGPYFAGKYLGRGVANLDWNRDGRRDFIVVHQDRPVALMENGTAVPTRGILVRLVGRHANRDAIGAKLRFRSNGRMQRRDINGGDGFMSTNERGFLIEVASGENLDIEWKAGGRSTYRVEELVSECIITEN